MNTSKRIAIIGAGEIGRSIGKILVYRGHQVDYWDKNSKILQAIGAGNSELPLIISQADFVFLCVPSWATREALLFTSPYLKPETVVISLAKGIETKTLKTIDLVMADVLPKKQPYGVLGGMMLSAEISEGLFGAGLFATKKKEAALSVIDLFRETNIRIETSSDLHGAALAGVLKNIYSLAIGLSYGLSWGENARGFLVSKSIAEMDKIIQLLGGENETAYSISGLGDLVATGFSPYSRNHEAGREIAKTGKTEIKSEGLASLPSLVYLLGDKYQQLPLLKCLFEITAGTADTEEAMRQILYAESTADEKNSKTKVLSKARSGRRSRTIR